MRRTLRAVLAVALALGAAACGEPTVAASDPACAACSPNATCQAKADGSKGCVCKDAFSGDGKSCTAVKKPDAAVCATCATDATCVLTETGSTVCRCKDGFAGSGRSCRKVLDTADCGGCDAQASCQRGPGGTPRCVCDAGVVGDGKTCHLPAGCSDFHGGCHGWATCELVGGRPRCTCSFGTEGDGLECLPTAGAYVQLKGALQITYGIGSGSCEAGWDFDVPLLYDGRHYAGHQAASVWDLTATVDVVDAGTGEVSVGLDLHAWQSVGGCKGDFRFATDPDATHTWAGVAASAPLEWFGTATDWSWASTNAATIRTFSGGLSAGFHAP